MAYVSPVRLRELLRFEPEQGELYWRPREASTFATARAAATWNTRYAGKEAFTNVIPGGYRTGTIEGRSYRAHRVAWAIAYGEWPSDEIDHVNGDRLDNRLANLRVATSSENGRNARRYSNNTSGHTGIYWVESRKRWLVKVAVGVGKHRQIGRYRELGEAIAARNEAWSKLGYSETHGSERNSPSLT